MFLVFSQEEEIEKMKELSEQNQKLMEENDAYKQVEFIFAMCFNMPRLGTRGYFFEVVQYGN